MKQTGPTPPKWANRLLEWYCRPELLEDLQGDLHEYFDRNLDSKGPKRAKVNYVIDVLKFMRPYTVKRRSTHHHRIQSDMFFNYTKTVFRNLAKHRLFSLINILGLAISMAICLLSISFVSELYSYDKFNEKSGRIFRLTSNYQRTGQPVYNLASSSIYAAKRIVDRYPEVEDAATITYGFEANTITKSDDLVSVSGHWASESFFKIFSYPLIQGNGETALKEPYSIVLTKEAALRVFGSVQVVGKTLTMQNKQDYLITGVMEDVPTNSHIQFEVLCSFTTKEVEERTNPRFESWTSLFTHYTYLLLPKNSNVNGLEQKLIQFSEEENAKVENREIILGLQPLQDIAVGTPLMNGIGFSIEKQTVMLVMGLTFLIMLSACFNYANLSMARSFKRTREIGVRKAIGSTNGQIFRLFLTESILISLIALGVAYLLFELLKGEALNFDNELQEAISLKTSPKLYLTFVAFAVIIGLMAGAFPAAVLSKTKATNALKGALLKVSSSVSVNSRKVLLVLQYTLSLGFILAASISFSQYKYALGYDLGFETDNIINIPLDGIDAQTAFNEFEKIPEVSQMSRSMLTLGTGRFVEFHGRYKDPQDSAIVHYNIIDEHYLPLHDFRFLAGNNFQKDGSASMQKSTIINETFLKRFGLKSPEEAIDELITLSGEKYRIIGVVEDFHSYTLSERIVPFTFLSQDVYPNSPGNINLKVSTGNMTEARAKIEAAWGKIDDSQVLDSQFYGDQIKATYASFFSMFRIVSSLAIIAISIATLGLLGMAIYTAEIKMREISIRKVLGAKALHLTVQMSRGLLLPVVFAALIAIPLTYLLFEQVILNEIVYRSQIGFLEITGGVMAIFIIGGLTVASQIFKTLRANPAQTLRTE